MPFRRRFNPPEALQVALQRFRQTGTPEDLQRVAVTAVRVGEFGSLPASIFLLIARDFPDLVPVDAYEPIMAATARLVDQHPYRSAPLGTLLEILHVVSAVHEKDWFPFHTLATTCPRGHEQGLPVRSALGEATSEPPARRRVVDFDMVELGANSYRRVEGTAPGAVEVGGFPEGGDPEGSILVCGVCNAAWPIFPAIQVDFA